MAKMCPNIANVGIFGHVFAILGNLKAPSGNLSSDFCRGGLKLQSEYSNMKMGQEITSEMRKMWGNLKVLNDHDKFDNLTKSLKITHFGA